MRTELWYIMTLTQRKSHHTHFSMLWKFIYVQNIEFYAYTTYAVSLEIGIQIRNGQVKPKKCIELYTNHVQQMTVDLRNIHTVPAVLQ